MEALVGNAADRKQVKRAKQLERLNAERELADLRSVIESVQGRRFVWGILEKAGVFRLSFAPGYDAGTTAFYEGRRAHGLELMRLLNQADPTAYHRMAQEAETLAQALKPAPTPEPTDEKEPAHVESDEYTG